MSPRSTSLKHELALVGVAVIWGVNFPVVKSALSLVGPLTFNALRFTVSGFFLGILYWREVARSGKKASVDFPWIYVIGLGLLGHLAYQLLFILGIDRTTAGNSAFLISSAPLWTGVFAQLGGFEQLSRQRMLGMAVAFIGAATLVVARAGISFGDTRMVGNLLSLGGAVAWGAYTALARPALSKHSATGLAFWTMLPAIPFLWAASFLETPKTGWVGEVETWLAVLYSGLLSIGVAYVIWNAAIRRVGPSHTAVYANMVPVVALLIGIVWLGETISGAEVAGAILILLGLYLVRR